MDLSPSNRVKPVHRRGRAHLQGVKAAIAVSLLILFSFLAAYTPPQSGNLPQEPQLRTPESLLNKPIIAYIKVKVMAQS